MAVATATYGAGFTNMVTGLAESRLARIPMVVVVGDAPSTGRRPFDIDQHTVTAGMNIPVVTIEPAHAGANITRAFEMAADGDRKSTRLNSSHVAISYAVFCLNKKKH